MLIMGSPLFESTEMERRTIFLGQSESKVKQSRGRVERKEAVENHFMSFPSLTCLGLKIFWDIV